MNLISVIVPIYNSEDYLRECIESILEQTYSNLEIILVDDGSSDGSLSICQEYQEKDSRIRIIHKENGGLSSARNAGLDVATGEFVMFCDADDFYAKNSCELLEREMREKNASYVIGNYINCGEDGSLWDKPIFDFDKFHNFQLSIHDYKNSFYIMSSSVCNKIFRLSFIRKLNLRFVEGVPAEDAIFTTYCFIHADSVYYISDVIYMYRQRNHGTSISTNNTLNYFKGISKAYHMIYVNFKNSHQFGFYRYFYLKTLFYIMYKFIDSKVMNDVERVEALKEIRWFCLLTDELSVQPHKSVFFQFLQCIKEEEYEKAIEIASGIREMRNSLSEEDKLKMSKIPPEEYTNYLIDEVEYV